MKNKKFQINQKEDRIKWKQGKSKEFFNLVRERLGFYEWKEIIEILKIPKNTFSDWLNEKLTTPAEIVSKCMTIAGIKWTDIEPLVQEVLDEKWGYYKANKELQHKYGKKLSEWASKGGSKLVEKELGPFSPEYPKRKTSGWISEGEERIAKFLVSKGITPINVELQRKKFGVKIEKGHVCLDMFLKELSIKLPTYLEFMGYRNNIYFERKLKRLKEASKNSNFRLIIVTPYPDLTKEFLKIHNVISIVKYGNWEKLGSELDSLSNL